MDTVCTDHCDDILESLPFFDPLSPDTVLLHFRLHSAWKLKGDMDMICSRQCNDAECTTEVCEGVTNDFEGCRCDKMETTIGFEL